MLSQACPELTLSQVLSGKHTLLGQGLGWGWGGQQHKGVGAKVGITHLKWRAQRVPTRVLRRY